MNARPKFVNRQIDLSRVNDTIHTMECRYARTVWLYSRDVTLMGVRAVAQSTGLKACGVCKPFKEIES